MQKRDTCKKAGKWKAVLGGVLFLALFFGAIRTAEAHRAILFAWVDGDTVFTKSRLSGGKAVKRGEIVVLDLKGNRLLKGNTDSEGAFSFRIPRKTSLKIVLNAGMGHRGEWTISEEEIESTGAGWGSEEADSSAVTDGEVVTKARAASTASMGSAEIEQAVGKVLDEKLQPVFEMLAEVRERPVSLADVLGGIGYIVGLVGLAAYLRYRKKLLEMKAP
ncbi:MAG: hypothetical protein GY866_08415 [Proteobacteria bacterium]|nr:hypothetical protein [Pseudomonadota bacterium]